MYSNYYGSYYGRGASGMIAGFGAGASVLLLAIAVFSIVCMWRVFVKAGEPGWKCLIPIYNIYVFYKIAWEAKYFLYVILGIVLAYVLMIIGLGSNSGAMSGIGAFVMVILYGAIFVLSIIAMVKLAKRFGKSGGFAVGLILLNTIFLAILAFDSSTYDRSRTDGGPSKQNITDDPYHSGDSNW